MESLICLFKASIHVTRSSLLSEQIQILGNETETESVKNSLKYHDIVKIASLAQQAHDVVSALLTSKQRCIDVACLLGVSDMNEELELAKSFYHGTKTISFTCFLVNKNGI